MNPGMARAENSNGKSHMFKPGMVFLLLFTLQAMFSGDWMYTTNWVLLLTFIPVVFTFLDLLKISPRDQAVSSIILFVGTLSGCAATLILVHRFPDEITGWGMWLYVMGMLLLIWEIMGMWSAMDNRLWPITGMTVNLLVPLLFGSALIYLWEILTLGFAVPQVLLPSPSLIALAFAHSTSMLWADFQQTFLKAVLSGYLMGCGLGFAVAVMVDRVPFLQHGLLPLGNLVSALPIVGIAPIMVMWFGFDWQSKAALVVIMTFFPMLVNTITGLASTGRIERDLMHSYAAGYWQNLLLLRLHNALPFIFNALKINSTLALIGAIVAEFFGTPIVGMGFRISTEVGRMNVDIVWATITVAALAGSLFYALIALCERRFTGWHPSFRNR